MKPERTPNRIEFIEGHPLYGTKQPTWTPRTYREYSYMWDDTAVSGNVYRCDYLPTNGTWYCTIA